MQKTLLFDLDGTLIDSTDAIVESFCVAYEKFSLTPPSKNNITALIGYPLDIMFQKLGVKGDVWDYVKAYKEHYRLISREKTILLPYAKEAIVEASQYARLGIVTTKTSRYSQELLEHMDVMQYFEVLIGREDVTNPKPHPEAIFKAREFFHSEGKNTWMIGDTILDLKAAQEAEIKSVGVLCGYGLEEELQKYTPILTKNSLEAVKVIQNH